MSEQKVSKVNSVLLSVCIMMLTGLGVVAYGGLEKADAAATGAARLQVSVDAITSSLMPRQEVQAKLDAVQEDLQKQGIEVIKCHERLTQLEIDVARFTGRAMSPKEKAN